MPAVVKHHARLHVNNNVPVAVGNNVQADADKHVAMAVSPDVKANAI